MTQNPTAGPAVADRPDVAAEYEYDVFVSYSDADEDWFRSVLLSSLEKAKLRIIHKRDFAPGVPFTVARERAVLRSRRTVLILTPAWCASEGEEFEGQIVNAMDPAARNGRLIPLRLQDCNPPPRIAHLVPADFTDQRLREWELRRLLKALVPSSLAVDEAVARSARKGIAWLATEFMRGPQVQEEVRGSEECFKDFAQSIDMLTQYKDLHDEFQKAEGALDLVLEREEKAEKELGDKLGEAVETLIAALDSLIDCAKNGKLRPDEVAWASKLERVRQALQAALANEDATQLQRPCERLNEEVGKVPTQLDKKLGEAVKQLRLEKLVDRLQRIRDKLSKTSFDEEALVRLGELAEGIDSLRRMDQTLRTLAGNHNWLQEIDSSLLPFDGTRRPAPEDLADAWPDIHDLAKNLSLAAGDDWVAPLQDLAGQLGQLLQPPPSEADTAAVRHVQGLFNNFRANFIKAFNQTDKRLLNSCRGLQKVGETLSQTIQRMQHG